MNILFIAGSYNPIAGGVERVTNILGRAMENIGHTVFLLCTGKDGDCDGAFKDVILMDKQQSESFDNDSVAHYCKILSDNHIDVIINQYPIAQRNDFFLKNTPDSIKKISFYHGSPLTVAKIGVKTSLKNGNPRKLLYWLKRLFTEYHRFCRIAQLSDSVGFLSTSFISKALPFNKTYRYKCFTIPNPNSFVLSPEEVDWAINRKQTKTVVFAGRLYDSGKNLIDFIKVWSLLSKKYTDWHTLIVGDDSNCDKYKAYIRTHNIERIYFTGKATDMKKVFLSADIQCITSHSEGWCLVLTEGMSCGVVPVVFNTFATASEFITDKKSGFLVKPYDINEMADKVSELIESPELLKNMRISAINRISEMTPQAIATRWEQIFH